MIYSVRQIENKEWLELDLYARLFPYIALAVWHDKGSVINDTLHQLHGPDMKFHPVHNEKDFAYHFETPGFQVVTILGTHTPAADAGNKSPGIFAFDDNGGFHNDFLKSGSALFELLKEHINSNKQVFIGGHSRGDPLAMIFGKCLVESGFKPVNGIGYCGPPACTKTGLQYMDLLDGFNYSHLIMPGDIVDNLGEPILEHFGKTFTPSDTGAYRDYPVVKSVFGHAYSSIYNVLGDWYNEQGKMDEVWWLRQLHWFCRI